MKKFFCVILAAVLMFSSFACAETLITVSGRGEVQVSADSAVVSLGVNVRDKDAVKAQQLANEKIAAIRQAVLDLGVEEDCVNTNYINIYASYSYENDREEIAAYSAASSLSIKVKDISFVGQVIDAAFNAGANTLDGISFSAGDTAEARTEAMKKAVADAQGKAETLAGASGLTITGMKTLTEGGVFSYENSIGNFAADAVMAKEEAYGAATVVQAAKIIVAAEVTISFEAE